MKTKNMVFLILFLSGFLFLPTQTYAQVITLDQLISFQKKSVSEINDCLLAKGWTFSNSSDESEDGYGSTVWAYEINQYETSKALSWLDCQFAKYSPNRIYYQTTSKLAYQNIKARINSLGMKRIDSEVGKNRITTYYKGKTVVLGVQNIRKEDESTDFYKFSVLTISDYNYLNFFKRGNELISDLSNLNPSDTVIVSLDKNTDDESNVIRDFDGNEYHTVQIGNQMWMRENLRTTHYNDGTPIPLITYNWSNLSTPAYCWYNNDVSYKFFYGALYNWYAVNTRKLAPKGWHVPTDGEWATLENYIAIHTGYSDNTAKALASKEYWLPCTSSGVIGNDLTLNNSSGFVALPGGCRSSNDTFTNLGYNGDWWSSTEYDTTSAYNRDLYYNIINVYRSFRPKSSGFSVRCVKD